MNLTITSGNGSIIITYRDRIVSIKVNQIKDIILTGSIVSVIQDYVYDPETYSANRIDIDYTEVTSPICASGEELFDFLNSSYATEIGSVSGGTTSDTVGSAVSSSEIAANYKSPTDFIAAYTSSTTITLSSLPFTITDSSQIVGIKVIPASGDAVVYKNGENGITMSVSTNVITISGVTDPFAM